MIKVAHLIIIATILTWFCFLLIVSIFNPLHLSAVSPIFYFSYVASLVLFLTSFLVAVRIKMNYMILSWDVLAISLEKLYSNKKIIISFWVLAAISIQYAVKFWSVILAQNLFSESRMIRFELGEVFTSHFEMIVYSFFVMPFYQFAKFIFAISYVTGNMRKHLAVLSSVILLSYFLFGGGRFIIMETILFCIFLYIMLPKNMIHKRLWLRNLFILLFMVVLFVFALYFRLAGFEVEFDTFLEILFDSLSHIILYSVGSFRAFDQSIDFLWNNFGYGLGIHTLAAFHEPYALIVTFLGYRTIPVANQVGLFTQEPVFIGDSLQFNALYTGALPFYLDFGYASVFIMPVLLGFLFGLLLKKVYRQKCIIDFFVAAYMFVGLFFLNYSWYFNSFSSIIPFLAILFYRSLVFKNRNPG
jgi:oligosaccharide repeat unit polymerase